MYRVKSNYEANLNDIGSYYVSSEDDEGWTVANGINKEQADYAVTILNNGGIDRDDWADVRDDVYAAVLYTNCVQCEKTFMQGTLDEAKVCGECRS